jgi:chlorophyllide a oxygenase
MANQVLGEDLRLVTGQQDRMRRGGRVWAHPVAYDKLGLVYRRWRNFSVGEACDVSAGIGAEGAGETAQRSR